MSEVSENHQPGFPNKISRILLVSMREVLGKNGINAVLNTARLQHLIENYPLPNFDPGLTFDEVANIFQAIEGVYGVRGGRRLAQQVGHVCFKHSIDGFGGVVGIADFALRLLPISLRVHIGLEVIAEIFNRYSDHYVTLGEDDENYWFVMMEPGLCSNRQTESPACSLMVGILEESLYWVSRGRRFWVEETNCIACGDPVCMIRVDKSLDD